MAAAEVVGCRRGHLEASTGPETDGRRSEVGEAASSAAQSTPFQASPGVLVRQHEDEVLLRHFQRWVCLFSILLVLATPAMIGLFVWMVVSYAKYRHVACDVPLQVWVHVVCFTVIFQATINRPTPTGSCVQRVFCWWSQDPEDPQPVPRRVRLYNRAIAVFVLLWTCIGLHWVRVDGGSRGELPSCREAAPSLYNSIKVYAAFNLATRLLMYVNFLGFVHVLRMAMRHGLLRTSQAASSGSLQKSTEVAKMADPDVLDSPQCSICLENFDEETEFVKTNTCKHLFHTKCLRSWLQVNHTCPLCREDLDSAPAAMPQLPI